MAIFDLYSKRQNDAAKAGQADVYRYDIVPSRFRVQFTNIAKEAFGEDRYRTQNAMRKTNPTWVWIDKTFCHEKGIRPLGGDEHSPPLIRDAFFRMSHDDAIDLLEVIGYKIHAADEETKGLHVGRPGNPKLLMDEVNYRLREASMGFQFEKGRLARVDSQFLHQQTVKPALSLLSRPGFEGVQEEFLNAHAHYRSGANKEAIAMAANSLESTLKAIFDAKLWAYNKGSRISDLMKVARANGLWPTYLDSSFDQLIATLQSGLPKIRDNDASHGQGAVPKEVSSYLAAYALHLAASTMVLLVSAADAPP